MFVQAAKSGKKAVAPWSQERGTEWNESHRSRVELQTIERPCMDRRPCREFEDINDDAAAGPVPMTDDDVAAALHGSGVVDELDP
jgi:hypothetical protein